MVLPLSWPPNFFPANIQRIPSIGRVPRHAAVKTDERSISSYKAALCIGGPNDYVSSTEQ
jgi:hypothetical protein